MLIKIVCRLCRGNRDCVCTPSFPLLAVCERGSQDLNKSTPPAQTACGDNVVETVVFEDEPVTEYEVDYVTVTVAATIWEGQTQYSTQTDWNDASACWQNGGWYGV